MVTDLRAYAHAWLNDNMCDGEDRSMATKDVHHISSKDLYEMVDDMLEDYERLQGDYEDDEELEDDE